MIPVRMRRGAVPMLAGRICVGFQANLVEGYRKYCQKHVLDSSWEKWVHYEDL